MAMAEVAVREEGGLITSLLTYMGKQFKDVPYIIRRHDTDVTVLPIKYLEELGSTAKNKLNSKIHGVGVSFVECSACHHMLLLRY